MVFEAKTSPPLRLIRLPKVNSQGRGLPFPSPLTREPKVDLLSLLLPFKWGLYSSDASTVSDVRDASNASKVTVS